jgi:guanylate kinase
MNEYYNEETFPEYIRLVQSQPNPDFKKISVDGSTPLTHNKMYRSPINGKDIFNFYNPDNMNILESQIVNITEETKNKVVRFMSHVHAEFDLTFENAYLVKNLVNTKLS